MESNCILGITLSYRLLYQRFLLVNLKSLFRTFNGRHRDFVNLYGRHGDLVNLYGRHGDLVNLYGRHGDLVNL